MRWSLVVSAIMSHLSVSALAEAPEFSGAARLRLETAKDTDSERAEALTLRIAPKVRWEPRRWLTFEGEVEAIAVLAGTFDDGEGLPSSGPPIPDPPGVDLNQLFLELRPHEKLSLTFGRQTIALGEERFVGAVAFRQNHQSFDAVRAIATLPLGLRIDASFVDRVRRPLGPRGQDPDLSADTLLLRAEIPSPVGTFSGFRYDLDLEPSGTAAFVPGGRSLTHGVGLDGLSTIAGVEIAYGGALAEQENRDTGERVRYRRASLGGAWGRFGLDFRYERLGGGTVGFQTPLGTNRAFQGHADIFLRTPPSGVEDLSIGAKSTLGDAGPLKRLTLSARYHRFEPAEVGPRHGRELDLFIKARTGRFNLSIERADYQADAFGEDTTRWWFTAATRF